MNYETITYAHCIFTECLVGILLDTTCSKSHTCWLIRILDKMEDLLPPC